MKKTSRSKQILFSGLVACALTMSSTVTAAKSQSLGGIVLTEVAPRIVTPNGDALNDKIFFKFDSSLTGLPLETDILDVNGAKVSHLQVDSINDKYLTWDGRDTSGKHVSAGIYVYSIKLGKSMASGTIVVAR